MTSAAASEKDLEIYASYVTNMLTNLGKLTLARIHNMLKMFVTEVRPREPPRAARAPPRTHSRAAPRAPRLRVSDINGAATGARAARADRAFSPQPLKYDKTEQQLQALLMTMVEEEKLEFVGGEFTLAHK